MNARFERTRVNQHLDLSRHAHNMWDAVQAVSPRLQQAMTRVRAAGHAGAAHAVREAVFGRLFENAPVAPEQGAHAGLVQQFVQQLEGTGKMEALARKCRGDWAACNRAAVALAEEFARILEEQPPPPPRGPGRGPEGDNPPPPGPGEGPEGEGPEGEGPEGDGPEGDGPESDNPPKGKGRPGQPDSDEDGPGEQPDDVPPGGKVEPGKLDLSKLEDALDDAKDRVDEYRDAFEKTFGSGGVDTARREDPDAAMAVAKMLDNPRYGWVQDVLSNLGQFLNLFAGLEGEVIEGGVTPVDVRSSRAFDNLLPAEMAGMFLPGPMAMLKRAQFANGRSLGWHHADVQPSGAGDFFVLLDMSGSMQDVRPYAVGFALAALKCAFEQGRQARLVLFDGHAVEVELNLRDRAGFIECAENIARAWRGGGTDFGPPFDIVFEAMRSNDVAGWDVLMITDGCAGFAPQLTPEEREDITRHNEPVDYMHDGPGLQYVGVQTPTLQRMFSEAGMRLHYVMLAWTPDGSDPLGYTNRVLAEASDTVTVLPPHLLENAQSGDARAIEELAAIAVQAGRGA
jgi:hypothetical protein